MNFYNIIKEFLGTFLLTLGLLSFNNTVFLGLLYSIILFLVENGSFNPAFTLVRYFAKKDTIFETIIIIFTQFIAGILSYVMFRFVN